MICEHHVTFQHSIMVLQEKDLHAKEEALKKRDIALQDSLLRFSKFLQVWYSLPEAMLWNTAEHTCSPESYTSL